MHKNNLKIFCILLFSFAFLSSARADVIVLNNGEKFDGIVLEEDQSSVLVDLGFGKMTFERSEIDRIEKDITLNPHFERANESDSGKYGDLNKLWFRVRNEREKVFRFKTEGVNLERKISQIKTELSRKYVEYKKYVGLNTSNASKKEVLNLNEQITQISLEIKELQLSQRNNEDKLEKKEKHYADSLQSFFKEIDLLDAYFEKHQNDQPFINDPKVNKIYRLLGEYKEAWIRNEIILKNRGKSYIVDVSINGQKEVPLILDTGATQTFISKKLATQFSMNIPQGSKSSVTLADGSTVLAWSIKAKSIRVGEFTVNNIEVLVIDSESPEKVHGLLGMNFLRNFTFEIDVKRKVLILEKFQL